jgi:hypothetical protein
MAWVILDGHVSHLLELDQPGNDLVRLVAQIDYSSFKSKLPPMLHTYLSFFWTVSSRSLTFSSDMALLVLRMSKSASDRPARDLAQKLLASLGSSDTVAKAGATPRADPPDGITGSLLLGCGGDVGSIFMATVLALVAA